MVGKELEIWNGFLWEEDGEEIEADGLSLAEEFEKDFDAFFGGGDGFDGAFHALEGTGCDFDFVADGEGWREGDEVGILRGLLGNLLDEGGDEGFWDGWDLGAEADEAADALGEGDGAFHFLEVKFGEDVAGEEGFEPPDGSAAGGFAVFDARAEDFDFSDFAEVFCGDVFALGLGADAEPFG